MQVGPVSEWLYERGIGEDRAVLVADGTIIEAAVERHDAGILAGSVIDARLIDQKSRLALATSGEELYLPRWPALAEGQSVRVEIRRTALAERDLRKRAVAQPVAPDTSLQAGPTLLDRLNASGLPVRKVFVGDRALDEAGWDETLDLADSGNMPFDGGLLRIVPTPAMTVIDVDGTATGERLAQDALIALARAIRLFGLAGNMVIDLPTLAGADARKAAAATFDTAMATAAAAFERTAINGFGLMQVIIQRQRPSLVEQLQFHRTASAALALLRLAERARGHGPLTLSANPRVTAWLADRPALMTELGRRIGRPVGLQSVPGLAMGSSHAQ